MNELAPPASAFDRPEVCPRCGTDFPCGVGRPPATPCACAQVRLGAELRAALALRWTRCLCPGCLRALAAGERP